MHGFPRLSEFGFVRLFGVQRSLLQVSQLRLPIPRHETCGTSYLRIPNNDLWTGEGTGLLFLLLFDDDDDDDFPQLLI
jgi:hypothetical protein